MSEFTPVCTAEDLATLNSDEICEGYHDGCNGEPEPGNNHSRSYWHGWRNGNNDRLGLSDPHQIDLIRDCRRVWGNDITLWGPR